MKTLTLLCLAYLWLTLSLLNYQRAIQESVMSEGSDLAIEQTMYSYGFNKTWHEEITTIDIIKAPIIKLKNQLK